VHPRTDSMSLRTANVNQRTGDMSSRAARVHRRTGNSAHRADNVHHRTERGARSADTCRPGWIACHLGRRTCPAARIAFTPRRITFTRRRIAFTARRLTFTLFLLNALSRLQTFHSESIMFITLPLTARPPPAAQSFCRRRVHVAGQSFTHNRSPPRTRRWPRFFVASNNKERTQCWVYRMPYPMR